MYISDCIAELNIDWFCSEAPLMCCMLLLPLTADVPIGTFLGFLCGQHRQYYHKQPLHRDQCRPRGVPVSVSAPTGQQQTAHRCVLYSMLHATKYVLSCVSQGFI